MEQWASEPGKTVRLMGQQREIQLRGRKEEKLRFVYTMVGQQLVKIFFNIFQNDQESMNFPTPKKSI